MVWWVLFPLNPSPVPGHYGEEGHMQPSSVWVSLTWLSNKKIGVIQVCGSYRRQEGIYSPKGVLLREYFWSLTTVL